MGILCFDDGIWPEFLNNLLGITTDYDGYVAGTTSSNLVSIEFSMGVFGYVVSIIAFVWMLWIMFISIRTLFHVTYRRLTLGDCCGLRLWILKFQMWGIVNNYGLFARMTTFRHELIIQGTMDDVSNYSFEELNDTSDVNRLNISKRCKLNLQTIQYFVNFFQLVCFDSANDDLSSFVPFEFGPILT